MKDKRVKHGKWGTATHSKWGAMIQRCTNKNHAKFKNWGGRGIKICKRWFDFKNFLADMGEPPKGFCLDRINPNKNYKPSNCRWVTKRVSAQNQRNRKDSPRRVKIVKIIYMLKASINPVTKKAYTSAEIGKMVGLTRQSIHGYSDTKGRCSLCLQKLKTPSKPYIYKKHSE